MTTHKIYPNGKVEKMPIEWQGEGWSGCLDPSIQGESGIAHIVSELFEHDNGDPIICATIVWCPGKAVLCRLPINDEQTDIEVESELLTMVNKCRREGRVVTLIDMRSPIPSFYNYAPIREGEQK